MAISRVFVTLVITPVSFDARVFPSGCVSFVLRGPMNEKFSMQY